ncbi:MAG: glucose-1-phosphate cytidylyltransferase [Desulfobacteraceae bacterium]|nr:MAG: glucose-1-phosphate cytidylyltransferase [Desulfobacteraceae bacterium]
MPVVILCGGFGTRLAEQTEVRPKPLVEIGGRPILWHIMKHYSRYGFRQFVLALGYKGEMIKRYFLDFYTLDHDFSVSLENGQVRTLNQQDMEHWQVHLIDTGLNTATGGRIKRLEPLIGKTTFMLTYGDGIGTVNLDELLLFHRRHGGLVTLTAVRPPARFGALQFEGKQIRHFKEKSTVMEGWINGGFFVIEPEALAYIQDDMMWEHSPMERLAEDGKLYGFQHEGFWQCMDTLRDLHYLESLWKAGPPPWKTW